METDPLPTAEQKPPRLRWYQWRLRTMFILTLFVAIGMSCIAVEIRDGKRQKAAAQAIEKAGGMVACKETWLGKLLRNDSLVKVTKAYLPRVSDDLAVHLQGLSQLKVLELCHSKVTDAELQHIEGMMQLWLLDLSDTGVTDAGLVHLQRLRQLGILHLQHTKVTDQGVETLQRALPNCMINR
jgi:hypothetical protein